MAQLLGNITSDGRVDEAEVQSIAEWPQANQYHKLPAIDHLLPAIQRVLADGIITSEERTFPQTEIEIVLPPELRRKAQLNRRESMKRARDWQPICVESESSNAAIIIFLAVAIVCIFGWIALQR